ncbi:DNA polymerase Y family protein [Rhizobium quercicola]|uniref:Y-family DNA polymerase n=1 Tax=Rhizobium quercicola TaxID=2901226 RepID=UPI003B84B0AA
MARRRWGASWLSNGRPDHPPVVFSDKVENAMRIVALDGVADRLRLKRGQGVAEARAMHPQLDVLPADAAADQAFLSALADWCDRYTPLVAYAGTDGLALDITGCTHLHGGEKALLDDVLSRLFQLGVEARGAIAASPGLAWALARFSGAGLSGDCVIETGEEVAALGPLPVTALRLPATLTDTLIRLGLTHVADLMEAPRAALARRFGPLVFLRLDQALGHDDEPLSPRRPVAELSVERRLISPVSGEDDILGLALQLATGLKTTLEARGEGGRQFELLLFRVDGKVFRLRAGTSSPLRDPQRIAALYRERLVAVHDDLDAGYGFEILRLCVLKAEPIASVQDDFSGRPDQSRALADFTDRVIARFGEDVLSIAILAASHIPERAAGLQPAGDTVFPAGKRLQAEEWPVQPVRPLRLLTHPERVEVPAADVPDGAPERFFWRRTAYRVARAEGPERIAAEWWIDGEDAPTRDYFRIEDETGRRFWMFRNGLFQRERMHPDWFMHGIFA